MKVGSARSLLAGRTETHQARRQLKLTASVHRREAESTIDRVSQDEGERRRKCRFGKEEKGVIALRGWQGIHKSTTSSGNQAGKEYDTTALT